MYNQNPCTYNQNCHFSVISFTQIKAWLSQFLQHKPSRVKPEEWQRGWRDKLNYLVIKSSSRHPFWMKWHCPTSLFIAKFWRRQLFNGNWHWTDTANASGFPLLSSWLQVLAGRLSKTVILDSKSRNGFGLQLPYMIIDPSWERI